VNLVDRALARCDAGADAGRRAIAALMQPVAGAIAVNVSRQLIDLPLPEGVSACVASPVRRH
jgi:hypothetical protein